MVIWLGQKYNNIKAKKTQHKRFNRSMKNEVMRGHYTTVLGLSCEDVHARKTVMAILAASSNISWVA